MTVKNVKKQGRPKKSTTWTAFYVGAREARTMSNITSIDTTSRKNETVVLHNFTPVKKWRFKYPNGEWRQERISVDDFRHFDRIWQFLEYVERLELIRDGLGKLEHRNVEVG